MRFTVIVLVLLNGSFSYSKSVDSCSKRELKLKNCHLKLDTYKLDLIIDKITIDNNVWRSVIDIPVSGKEAEWKTARIKKLGKRYFLELKVWNIPKSNLGLQKLKWDIFELIAEKAYKVISKNIQMRRKESSKNSATFIYDPQEQHGLKLNKSKITYIYKNKSEIISQKKIIYMHNEFVRIKKEKALKAAKDLKEAKAAKEAKKKNNKFN